MLINVSNGELFDKYSILLIKLERINDLGKLEYISSELNYMKSIIDDNFAHILDFEPYERLFETNNSLWDIENRIRQKEEAKQFDDEFVKLSRDIYFLNDERHKLKRMIDDVTGSEVREQKSHKTCEG